MEMADAQREMAAIRRLMEESRNVVHDQGKHFIAWGILMSAALVATYVLVARESFGAVGAAWGVAILLGWIFSLREGRRDYRRAPVRTVASRLLSAIWVGFGITATLIGLLGIFTGAFPAPMLGGTMAILIGGACFSSGFLDGLHWLRYVGAAWWLGGVAMLVWPGLHSLLVFAGMMLLLQVGPGLLLRHRAGSTAAEASP